MLRIITIPSLLWLCIGCSVGAVSGVKSNAAPTDKGDGASAWIHFVDGPERYGGIPYRWLGRKSIRLMIDVKPTDGHALELLWGSKNDTRTAVVRVNGKDVKVQRGGYDGFRWERVPIPTGVRGERYEVALRAGAGTAAFLAAVRLTSQTGAVARVKGDPPAHRITLKKISAPVQTPGAAPEAFVERRNIWDTPHPPPATSLPNPDAKLEAAFRLAELRARRANEGFFRCRRYVDGWLRLADPESGLIPRNRRQRFWNAKDSAADNYPFMVLTAAITDRALFEGRMREMLRSETKLTSRVDRLPDTYVFATKRFQTSTPRMDKILFGASEYIKDGLLPLTEWLGPSPWSERMLGILDDMWKHAAVDTPYGKIVSDNVELNGELLQTLSRVYWMTGQERYLDWACRLGDYYLLGDHHPTRDFARLRLRDHGCEIVSGLCELYAAVHFARPAKKQAYQRPIHEMLDRILEVGRNEHGLFFNKIDPRAGKPIGRGIADTWGYTLNGYYTVFLIDKTEAYRQATRKALGGLYEHYRNYPWEGKSADGYADSIESALNLYNREPVPSAARWINSEIRVMWRKQQPDGVIEGWHGDGNFARTTIMYCLWQTQGLTVRPWREDVFIGAARHGETLVVSIRAARDWQGKIRFDIPRHRTYMKLPLDWPRINQFPEWFTVNADTAYTLENLTAGTSGRYTGAQLRDGVALKLKAGVEQRLRVR